MYSVRNFGAEMDQLKLYGTMYPSNMLGLAEEQITELNLYDEWGEKCVPKGGWKLNADPISRRNGKQPAQSMQDIISKAVNEARGSISKVMLICSYSFFSKR